MCIFIASFRNDILSECRTVALGLEINPNLPEKKRRKRKRFFDEEDGEDEDDSIFSPEENFRRDVFLTIIDSVISGLTVRYESIRKINDIFSFLWCYLSMNENDVIDKVETFGEIYDKDVNGHELRDELLHLKSIHESNFGKDPLGPLDLLNKIHLFNLNELFSNTCIALRIFITLPVTVASAERSFSKLNLIKSFLRSTMEQERLNDLALLSIESDISRNINYDSIIEDFALKKARKGF